jgi:hypothetical protein
MNPPGRGYLQREPLDPAQIRRWVYHKEVSELPAATLQHSTRALFNLEGQTADPAESAYLFANDSSLTPEQLKDIPGIEVILPKYLEFHEGAKELLRNRTIAADQPQKFFFDDREEPKRVRDFIATFYRGDINQTMQDALRYYYAGKLLEREDKEKLEELIRTVEYVPSQNSRRKGLEEEKQQADAVTPDTDPGVVGRGEEIRGLPDAERIMGRENLLGPADVEKVFGIKLDRVPDVPFTKEELERAKKLGQQLILQVDTMKVAEKRLMGRSPETSAPLTLENLKKRFEKAHDGKRMFYDQSWYDGEDFFKSEKPRAGWKLTSKEVLADSTSKNYLQQTDLLASYLSKEVFKGSKVPPEYESAISEFNRERAKIERLMDSDWQKASEALANLKITQLTRELPVEAMYRLILQDGARDDKLLPSTYTWTGRRASDGRLVYVGSLASDGADVYRASPDYVPGFLGVCLSRMK